MRPAGPIPSFQPDRVALLDQSTREGRRAQAAFPFLLGLQLALQQHEATVEACLSPARGLQPPFGSFKTLGRVPRRDAPSASPRSSALSARITCGLIHPLVFACHPFREDLRAGFPCALGHLWLVTLPQPIGARCLSELATSGTVEERVHRAKNFSREQAVRNLCK
jgi:hypothetical protein